MMKVEDDQNSEDGKKFEKKLSAVNERVQPSKKEMPPIGHQADYFHPK
jgi:hypothetical protein